MLPLEQEGHDHAGRDEQQAWHEDARQELARILVEARKRGQILNLELPNFLDDFTHR